MTVTRRARGIEEMTAALVEWIAEWSDLRFEAERFVDLGDRVLVLARHRGVGRRSGCPCKVEYPRRDPVDRAQLGQTPAAALKKVGQPLAGGGRLDGARQSVHLEAPEPEAPAGVRLVRTAAGGFEEVEEA